MAEACHAKGAVRMNDGQDNCEGAILPCSSAEHISLLILDCEWSGTKNNCLRFVCGSWTKSKFNKAPEKTMDAVGYSLA